MFIGMALWGGEMKIIQPGSWDGNVWDDINRMRTFNGEQARKGLVMHICLARDSQVLTKERGYVPIQTVEVGEYALTHMGRWRKILAVQNTGVRKVITVKAHGGISEAGCQAA